jgi:hypothetical protein
MHTFYVMPDWEPVFELFIKRAYAHNVAQMQEAQKLKTKATPRLWGCLPVIWQIFVRKMLGDDCSFKHLLSLLFRLFVQQDGILVV